jgi:tetratricopeptide (TPR) repeat protein
VDFQQATPLRFAGIAAVTIVASFGPLPAGAQTPQQLNSCYGKDGATLDLRIAGCTAVIQSGRFAGKELAIVFVNRGTAHRIKEDKERAIADYTEAIRLDPKNIDAFFFRAVVYRGSSGERALALAIADLDAVIRLDPKHTSALYSRGFAHHTKGDYDRAIADYNEAIRLGYQNPDGPLSYRGHAYFCKKDFERAIADYNAALKINPKNVESLYARGLAKKKRGDAGADADMSAALAIRDFVAKQLAGYGVK